MSRVYVGNLSDGASKRELEREFESFGPLRDVWVARNPPGFAFVVFEDKRDAEDAIKDLDGRPLCGSNRIRVEMARGPTRGGRAARLGLTEKCYECGRIGHFARDCTRRPGFSHQDSRGRRSRSPPRRRRRYSRSRSRSPQRRRERSRSYEKRYDRRSQSRSLSGSRSPSRERQSPKYERSPVPSQEKNGDDREIAEDEEVGDNRSRSPSPNE